MKMQSDNRRRTEKTDLLFNLNIQFRVQFNMQWQTLSDKVNKYECFGWLLVENCDV